MSVGIENFRRMTEQEQAFAVRLLIEGGLGEYTVAHATQLSVEQIRRIMAESCEHHE
jgi:DNA-binding GntR family transcriptional regulator